MFPTLWIAVVVPLELTGLLVCRRTWEFFGHRLSTFSVPSCLLELWLLQTWVSLHRAVTRTSRSVAVTGSFSSSRGCWVTQELFTLVLALVSSGIPTWFFRAW